MKLNWPALHWIALHTAWMAGWLAGWMDGRMYGQKDCWTNRQRNCGSIFIDKMILSHQNRVIQGGLAPISRFCCRSVWQFGTCLKFWAPPSPLPAQFHCCISGKPCCKRWARWARSWFQRPASTSICTSTRHNRLWANDFASQRVPLLDFDLVRCSSLSEDF